MGPTLGAGAGIAGGFTLGGAARDFEDGGVGSTLGAEGRTKTKRGVVSSFHLLKISRRLSMAMS
jgi:hypothetical protein